MSGIERREIVAHLANLPRFPGEDPQPEAPGDHVMGVTVHAWLAGEPLRRWGETWLRGGSMSLRFRRPVHVGDPLTLTLEPDTGSFRFELRAPDGDLAADGGAAETGPGLLDPTRFDASADVPDPKLRPEPAAIDGRDLGRLDLDFEPSRDLEPLRLDADDPWRKLAVAHPAWITSGVNELIARSIEMTHGRWIHAGTTVRSVRPIEPGAGVRLVGRIERLFERGTRRFADVATLVLADDEPAMEVITTIVYG